MTPANTNHADRTPKPGTVIRRRRSAPSSLPTSPSAQPPRRRRRTPPPGPTALEDRDPHQEGTTPGRTLGPLYDVGAAARWLSISRSKVYELMASGELASVQIDRSRRITRAALEDYVERLSRATDK